MNWLDLILVGIGGIFGGLFRFILGRYISRKSDAGFPTGTLIINISGAVLLGAMIRLDVSNSFYLLLGNGFLGAYTTFSTFMYEGIILFKDNKKLNAIVYILGTLFLGIIGFAAGFESTGLIIRS